jgi:hypothetical protein
MEASPLNHIRTRLITTEPLITTHIFTTPTVSEYIIGERRRPLAADPPSVQQYVHAGDSNNLSYEDDHRGTSEPIRPQDG